MCWYLQGKVSLEEAVALYKTATRRYAKRQLTWFRADGRLRWFDAAATRPEEIVRIVREQGREGAREQGSREAGKRM
jgi:tRNA A37 N6-isopentenylltransferase MiaA